MARRQTTPIARRVRGLAGFVVAFALTVAVVHPGGEAIAAPTPPIVGHVFRSLSVEQDGRPAPLFDGAPPVWLTIDRRSFGLYAGCNTTGGPLRVTATRLRTSEMAQTAVGCLPAEVEQRDDLLTRFLGGDPEWR